MPNPRYRTVKRGQKVSLELTVKDYEKLMEDLEELESIRAFDAAQRAGESPIPLKQAIREIERTRA
jgi:hypothetical protein